MEKEINLAEKSRKCHDAGTTVSNEVGCLH
jgi:hypothetical protein